MTGEIAVATATAAEAGTTATAAVVETTAMNTDEPEPITAAMNTGESEPIPAGRSKSAEAEEEEPPLSELFRITPSRELLARKVRVMPSQSQTFSLTLVGMNCMFCNLWVPGLVAHDRPPHTVERAWMRLPADVFKMDRKTVQPVHRTKLLVAMNLRVHGGQMWIAHSV